MRRLSVLVCVCCAYLSLLAFVMSLGLPGVGWAVGMLALVTVSLLSHWGGRKYVVVTFLISTVHLFTLGPLSGLGKSTHQGDQPPVFFLIIFVIVPMTIALLSIFMPGLSTAMRKSRRK
ncbi:hypothetical protein EGT07_22920 [Herbaspirillum sp. HC18]|nr:hypothetical protein EGT07_22920 [Herbaspirillum sp. HC18]